MLSELSLISVELTQGSGRSCFSAVYQAEDVVVLHPLRQVQADIPVLFLDTGYHFPGILMPDQLIVRHGRRGWTRTSDPQLRRFSVD
jgi:hypothetical protein